jgi:hypothetical protein
LKNREDIFEQEKQSTEVNQKITAKEQAEKEKCKYFQNSLFRT